MTNVLGENLRKAREAKGLSREQLAKRVGICATSIVRYETTNLNSPSLYTIAKMADVLDCSIDGLMGRNKYVKQDFETLSPLETIIKIATAAIDSENYKKDLFTEVGYDEKQTI